MLFTAEFLTEQTQINNAQDLSVTVQSLLGLLDEDLNGPSTQTFAQSLWAHENIKSH